METPESLVYRGREGTGFAQVFGREGNPMQAFKQRKADIEYKRALAAEQARLAKEKRDKDLWALINVDPDKAYEPFDRQIRDEANQHRQNIASMLDKTGGLVNDQLRLFAKKGWDDINTKAAKSQYIKNTLAETKEAIQKDPYLDFAYYFPKLNDLYLDENGNAKPLEQINADEIKDIHIRDVRGFNEKKYRKEFMDGLNENMSSYVTQKAVNNGILTEDNESKWKGDLYIPDSSSPLGVKVDNQGNPILNITPEFINSYTSSDTAKRYYESIAKEKNMDIKDVVRETISPAAGLKVDVKPSFSRNPIDWSNRYGLKPWEIQQATNRATKIKSLINAVNSDGSVSPEAQSAAGIFRNARFGDGHILDAKIIPGTNTPGTTEAFPGMVVSNSPHPRLVFNVKYSDRGLGRPEEVALDNEAAFETLNGLIETSKAEGGNHFSTDQMIGLMGWNLNSIYQGNQGKALQNEQAKARENELVTKIMQSPVDAEIPDLQGRYFNGNKITGAKRVVSERGWSPGIFGKPWGQKEVVEIEVTDSKGKKTYHNLSEYEDVAKIVRGEGKSFAKKYQMDGKEITLDQLKKSYSDEEIQQAIEAGILK
jgi:hypothetical protein